jgi:hypothetical protein
VEEVEGQRGGDGRHRSGHLTAGDGRDDHGHDQSERDVGVGRGVPDGDQRRGQRDREEAAEDDPRAGRFTVRDHASGVRRGPIGERPRNADVTPEEGVLTRS